MIIFNARLTGKQIKKILTLSLFAFSTMAIATSYVDEVDILGSEAIYTNVSTKQPYQHCYEVSGGGGGGGSATNELIGGILGGAIGNRFGSGDGKKIMTVAGSLLGASIANDIEKAKAAQGNTKQICETRYRNETSKSFSHYLVYYKYKGARGYYKSSQNPVGDEADVLINISVEDLPPRYVKTKKDPFKKVSDYFNNLIN